MAVYAISKVYYRKTKWAPDQRHKALAAQSPLNVHVCVACCGEETHEIKSTCRGPETRELALTVV